VLRWIKAMTPSGRIGRIALRRPHATLPGLRLAAQSLETSMRDLMSGAEGPRSVDVQRLCAASYSAGRLVGYMEALSATDANLARQAASELEGAMRALDAVRETFLTAS